MQSVGGGGGQVGLGDSEASGEVILVVQQWHCW